MRIPVLFLVLLPTAAWADTAFVAGIGPTSCGKVVAALEADSTLGQFNQTTQYGKTYVSEKQALMQWVQGFITAANFNRGPSQQIQEDYATVELWIRNYCTAHPTDRLFDAAMRFTRSQAGTPPK
jgi:hypothetical protein